MSDHRVEITDGKGQRMQLSINLQTASSGMWQAIDFGYFRYMNGVVDTCYSPNSVYYSPASPVSWVALYGGSQVDDNKLVLHLDDFCSKVQLSYEGTGKIYFGDTILAEPGGLTWRLLDRGFTGL